MGELDNDLVRLRDIEEDLFKPIHIELGEIEPGKAYRVIPDEYLPWFYPNNPWLWPGDDDPRDPVLTLHGVTGGESIDINVRPFGLDQQDPDTGNVDPWNARWGGLHYEGEDITDKRPVADSVGLVLDADVVAPKPVPHTRIVVAARGYSHPLDIAYDNRRYAPAESSRMFGSVLLSDQIFGEVEFMVFEDDTPSE